MDIGKYLKKPRRSIALGILSLLAIMMFILPTGVVSATTVNLGNAMTDAFYQIEATSGETGTWTPSTFDFSPTTTYNQYVYDQALPTSDNNGAWALGYVAGLLIVQVTIRDTRFPYCHHQLQCQP